MNDKNTKKKYTIMSGGTFDYSQRTIELIADDIEQTILEAGRKIPDVLLEEQQHRYSREIPLEEQYYPSYNRKTMDIMKRAVYILRMAYIYAQRIDWMLSGDDGEDDLVRRLDKELHELKTKYRRRGKCPWIAPMQPNQNILVQRNSCPKKVLPLHHGKETFII